MDPAARPRHPRPRREAPLATASIVPACPPKRSTGHKPREALLLGSGEALDGAWGVGNARGPRLPLALVPTTARTGLAATPVSIITVGEGETRWSDNDVYGHMNNVVHDALFDTAVNGWLIEQGALDPRGGERIGLVVETGCRYLGEIAFPDSVTAGLHVARIGTSSVRYEVGLFRNEEATASAEGHFIHVYVDRLSRRPAPLGPGFRQILAGLAGNGMPPS